jgi:hypothetical protein
MNHGGQTVKAGLYLGLRSGEWVTITRDGVVLPGTSREIYVGRKTAIAIGPFLGLAYCVLPGCWPSARHTLDVPGDYP